MVKLRQVRLINWYGFNQITVPVGFFTLIAGKNGNGKSVFLDAVKYALYGDTVFNKSTENRGSRTVPSYTRGLLDATAGTYMRAEEALQKAREVERLLQKEKEALCNFQIRVSELLSWFGEELYPAQNRKSFFL